MTKREIYDQAVETARLATIEYRTISTAYMDMKIDDEAYLAGRAAHDEAQFIFDAAEAKYIS